MSTLRSPSFEVRISTTWNTGRSDKCQPLIGEVARKKGGLQGHKRALERGSSHCAGQTMGPGKHVVPERERPCFLCALVWHWPFGCGEYSVVFQELNVKKSVPPTA